MAMKPDLSTTYMGIPLKNPVIAGASKLTADLNSILAMEESGAAAVVCSSLFEEQIQLEQFKLERQAEMLSDIDAEIQNVFPSFSHAGPREHLMWVKEVKKRLSIPVIASLNAVNRDTWLDYARQLEDTGVDGLEFNFYFTPGRVDRNAEDIEKEQIGILEDVKAQVKIPVSAKLSFFYTNPLNVIKRLDSAGASAFVLFNRLFESDVDPDEERHSRPFNLSHRGDYKLSNRFAGMLYQHIQADICTSTGIFTGKDVVKGILSGATAVQVVSALYKHKIPYLASLLEDLESWMVQKNYAQLSDFQGKLAAVNLDDKFLYRRAQYVDLLLRSEELLADNEH